MSRGQLSDKMSSESTPVNTATAVDAFVDAITHADQALHSLDRRFTDDENQLERTLRELPTFIRAEYNRGKTQLGRAYAEDTYDIQLLRDVIKRFNVDILAKLRREYPENLRQIQWDVYGVKTLFIQSLFRQRVRQSTNPVSPAIPAVGPCGDPFVANPLSPFCVQAQQYQQDPTAVCYIAESTKGGHPESHICRDSHGRGSSGTAEGRSFIRKLGTLHLSHPASDPPNEPNPQQYRCYECDQLVICWEDPVERRQSSFASSDGEFFQATPRFYVKCHMAATGELLCVICNEGVEHAGVVVKSPEAVVSYKDATALKGHLKTHTAMELVRDADMQRARNPRMKSCSVM